MAIGTVKWFNPAQGFGFIQLEGDVKDIFVHRSGFQNGVILDDGDKVEFDMIEGNKGPVAHNVAVLKKTPALPLEVY